MQCTFEDEIAAKLFATTVVSEIVDSGGNKMRIIEEREASS